MVKKTKTTEKKAKNTSVNLSLEGIKNFIEFTKGFNVYSVSLKEKDKKITVFNNIYSAAKLQEIEQGVEPKEAVEDLSDEAVKSKFVGVFHPVKDIQPGKEVKKGTLLGKIYSMKIEHQIKAEKDCIIKKILVAENAPVDYGKPLFIIK